MESNPTNPKRTRGAVRGMVGSVLRQEGAWQVMAVAAAAGGDDECRR